MLCLEIIPRFIAPALLLKSETKATGSVSRSGTTEQDWRLLEGSLGSSKPIEEATCVKHFVGSSGEETQ